MNSKVIHWFRQDLRITDNPALYEAAKEGTVIPIYILDDENAGKFKMGGASRWWLHHSLESLNKSLDNKLQIFQGNPENILWSLTKKQKVQKVYWNRCYEPWSIQRDKKIKSILQQNNIDVFSYNGFLLWEPWQVLKKDNTPYKVFTPFYRKGCLGATPPREPLPKPEKLKILEQKSSKNTLASLELLPKIRWDKQLVPHWQIGEEGAHKCLNNFLKYGLSDYKEGRNYPNKKNVSRLSPYLHFGEISPNQIWYAAKAKNEDKNLDHFLSELGWREFSNSLLYHFPSLPEENLQSKFDSFAWDKNPEALQRWQKGQTGYPIVDAGMRELWQTGYMHNRVRMIVGSFLVKNLLIHWHQGERWFWDTLVDADLANNSASWQWVAGCGADAAPYFRIFNPITQGTKFDATGEYTRKYIPELAKLPDKYLFCPWEAPDHILNEANVILGKNYPNPIVDVKVSREKALAAFKSLKTS